MEEIAARLQLAGENRYRARAYAAGAERVAGMSPALLARRIRAGTLSELPGIGGALAALIAEVVGTGRSELLETLRAAPPPARRTSSEGTTRLRLMDARAAMTAFVRAAGGHPAIGRLEIAGGVRRWEEIVDELSLVVVAAPGGSPGEALRAASSVLAEVDRGIDRASGRLADGTRVRLRATAAGTAGRAMIEQTGPREHLSALEARASSRGRRWEALRAEGEAEIYEALGLPWVPPEARALFPVGNGGACTADDLADLVTVDDIQGMVHCHTTYSDGRDTLLAMARAADARGIRYLTVTDHSPAAAYAGGLTLDRLRRQWDAIARVQEKVKVRLLRGTESDILADGSLDYPDAVLAELDVIIASIHVRHRMGPEAMTERLVRAMRQPYFKIWGHALGRLLLRRDPIGCDLEAVLDAVADSPAAIELSGDPYRLDLPPAWIPAARARGIRFVVSVDAHAVGDLDNLEYGVAMARRGLVRRAEVLNTLPAPEFAAAVRPASERASGETWASRC